MDVHASSLSRHNFTPHGASHDKIFTVNSWLLGVATIVGVRNVCSRTLNVLMTQTIIAHFSGTKPKMRDVLVKMRLCSQIRQHVEFPVRLGDG